MQYNKENPWYRYHRANIIDRISSVTQQTNSEPDAPVSLHLILRPGEICIDGNTNNSTSYYIFSRKGEYITLLSL